jgi:hypothetical protein
MVSILSLWLPIVLAAVLVFLGSSVLHMLLTYHRRDHAGLSGEAEILAAMRQAGVTPGDYFFPHASTPKEMRTPEMIRKLEQGPVGFLTVLPNGPPAMGAALIQWLVYTLVVGVLVAYVTGRTVAPGAEYLQVFRVAGAVAFIAYAGAHPSASIWGKRRWSTTFRHIFDGFVYGLLTAGAFAGFWPE